MKPVLIINPNAGRKDPASVNTALRRLGRIEVWPTERAGHAEELARRAAERGAPLVIAAGGDATVGEVLNGLADHLDRVRMGILPLGTGNDFVRGLNIPLEAADAVSMLAAGHTRRIDVVRVLGNGRVVRYYLNVAVSGFDEEAKKRIEQGFKSGWGPLGYLFASAAAIPEITTYQIRLQYDDGVVEGLEGSMLAVANSGSFGGGIPLLPAARPDDGRLDVLAFRPVTSAGLLMLAPSILAGTHLENENDVYHRTARRVTIAAAPPLPFHIDDQYFTTDPDLTFEVMPGALELIVPEPELGAEPLLGIEVA